MASTRLAVLVVVSVLGAGASASADVPQGPGALSTPNWGGQASDATEINPPSTPPAIGSERLRLSVDFLAGYGVDRANASLGFERQGRVGYAVFTAQGTLNGHLSYLISMNPVNETAPLPGCGAAGYFFPNDPKQLYGSDTTVPCAPTNGTRRVDAYRSIAFDVVPQQGAVREAYMDVRLGSPFRIRFGRTRLPLGFDFQEAGSFSSKDALRIQRINARASFGTLLSYVKTVTGRRRPLWTGTLGAYVGEGNRWLDYNYYYFEEGSLAANSGVTGLLSSSVSPVDALEIRAAYQFGNTGSKVERLPSYWASKRHDNALVLSVAVQPFRFLRVIAEKANYTWGPTATSAEMLGVSRRPIAKNGHYVTAEAWWPIRPNMTFGGSVSRERLDREDSLVRFAADQGLFNVTRGRKDGMSVFRAYVDLSQQVRLGVYKDWDLNPFPWLSGIRPVTGPNACTGKGTNKWGMTVRLGIK